MGKSGDMNEGASKRGRKQKGRAPAARTESATGEPCRVVGIGASAGGQDTLDEELATVFALVKARTGHDFSSYKRNMLIRRIERRMAVNDVAGMKQYIALLEANEQESRALGQEVLIGVTSFFRDPEAFETLRREIIPRLFANRDPDEPVRIWHACCATGEEVYSTAILIREYLDEQRLNAKVQLFATDIDEAAIAQARAGLYPDGIEADVGEERLKVFFTRAEGRWQVAKPLREMVVFAHHSLIKDPPFSRLDLLVCRNFLIYLNPDMQKRLISLFHLALKPGGFLFLGAAETVGRQPGLFTPLDKKLKIFKRLQRRSSEDSAFPLTAPVPRISNSRLSPRPIASGEPDPGQVGAKLIMERYSPPWVVVNEKYDVVHVSIGATRFLEVPEGEPTRDILRMAREELRPALRAAIYKTFAEQQPVVFRGVKVASNGKDAAVKVLVEPLKVPPPAENLALVVLEPVLPSAPNPASSGGGEALAGDEASNKMLIRQLEEQLRITHEQLQALTEQLETSQEGFMSANEELMSINEEYQSANEELQSTNEELETSKEELQALNEELVTVNAELQGKVEELDRANSDMENLFRSSEIATFFLDRQLIIRRFSPAMAEIFNLIPADIGRPFRHLAGTIDWTGLPEDAGTVLESLAPVEREVAALEGNRHYLMRVLPYRTTEGGVDGVAVTLVDITERKRAEAALRESEERMRLFIEHAPAALAMFDREMRYLSASRRWRSDYGLGERELNGMSHYEIFPEIPAEWREAHRRGLAGEVLRAEGDRFERADGSVQWVKWEVRPWLDAAGKVGGIILFTKDITERKRAEEALRQSEERLKRAQEISHLGSWELDLVDNSLTWSDEVYRIFGLQPQKFAATYEAFLEAVHPDDRWAVNEAYAGSLREGRDAYEIEHRVVRKSTGEIRYVHEKCEHFRDEAGRITRSVGMVHDVTERKQAEDRLRENQEHLQHLAYHDALTNLPNRLLFREHLAKSIAAAKRSESKVAVLLLDLDRFKNINDSLGHQAGDKVLRQVADRLRYWLRQSDIVARLGGDEFGIILNQIDDFSHAAAVARKLLAILPEPIHVEGHELAVTGSLGIGVFPADAVEEESLLKFADAAMYRAKESGRNNFQFFTPDMNARTHEFLLMETALRKALENEQFLLHFQPLIDLEQESIVGVEALLRWRHPTLGLVSPADFIPLAEETGLIISIGEWVLETACRQAGLWQEQGLPPIRMAVNISGRQFREADFVDKVERILRESGLDPQFLELEITESVVMENVEKAIMTWIDLKVLGISLSVDDFGTGYSSLNYLKQFPIHSLKIDRAFVRDVTSDTNDAAIASSVIALAHTMGLQVVGEGIETEEQLRFLKERGCDMGQGYLFSRPLPAEEIVREIRRWEQARTGNHAKSRNQ